MNAGIEVTSLAVDVKRFWFSESVPDEGRTTRFGFGATIGLHDDACTIELSVHADRSRREDADKENPPGDPIVEAEAMFRFNLEGMQQAKDGAGFVVTDGFLDKLMAIAISMMKGIIVGGLRETSLRDLKMPLIKVSALLPPSVKRGVETSVIA
jgi:hypothetical protein